jgi:hypothetical protein
MDPTPDIADDLEPEPASASSVREPAARARPLRGHQAAIHMAVTALRAAGHLRPGMMACRRNRLILDWISANVDRDCEPSRWAISRYFEWEVQSAPNAH